MRKSLLSKQVMMQILEGGLGLRKLCSKDRFTGGIAVLGEVLNIQLMVTIGDELDNQRAVKGQPSHV